MPEQTKELYVQLLAKGRLHLAYVFVVAAIVALVAVAGVVAGRIGPVPTGVGPNAGASVTATATAAP